MRKYCALFILLAFVISSCKQSNVNSVYSFVFYESTGENKFIEISGILQPLVFHEKSKIEKVQLLNKLKYNVLYPNSRKRRIFLIGFIRDNKFVLRDWFIKSPFWVIESSDEGPESKVKVIIVEKLIKDYFNNLDDKNIDYLKLIRSDKNEIFDRKF